jgi:hypothetical protein
VANLPLFDSPVAPNASHRVRAPGGYEIWRFAAHDPASQTWFNASFHEGFPSHDYIRRYLRYRRRPTRVAPPLPQESAVLCVSVYARGRMSHYAVRFDPHALLFDSDGSSRLSARNTALRFRPRCLHAPIESSAPPNDAGAETHRWLVSHGLCNVDGVIDLAGSTIPFAGSGFHDHRYGTAPILYPSLSGSLFLKGKAFSFQTTSRTAVATFASDSTTLEDNLPAGAWRGRTGWGLAYPRSIRLKEEVIMANPRAADSHPRSARIVYEADSFGGRGIAICEISDPCRFSFT